MIRLGSLGGYSFEGPRRLGGWAAPQRAAVYAVLVKGSGESYTVIYVGHSPDLSAERFPFRHPRAPAWIARAGDKWSLYIATFEPPGAVDAHREQITRELIAVYHPSCNTEQYDQAWRAEWIGDYSTPTTKSLTTPKTLTTPDEPS